MPKIKFDVSSSDPDEAVGGNFEPPRPGVYIGKVKEIEDTKSKSSDNPMLKIVYSIEDEGDHKGAWVWDYIVMTEASAWRLDQFLQAVGVASKKKRKGQFDTDAIVGELVKLRIKADKTPDGDYSAKVGAVLKYDPDEDDAGDDLGDDLEDEDDLDDIDDEEEDLLDDDDDLEDDIEEEDYLTEEDLKAMDVDDLKKTAKDFDVSIKGKKKAAVIAAILEAQAAPEEGDAEDDYDDWSVSQLKAELKERGLKSSGKQAELIERLREDDDEEPF